MSTNTNEGFIKLLQTLESSSDCTMIVTSNEQEYTIDFGTMCGGSTSQNDKSEAMADENASKNDTLSNQSDESQKGDSSKVKRLSASNSNDTLAETQVYKLHRKVLRDNSPVFKAMFEYKDTKEYETGVIDVKNVKPYIMCQALRLIYGEKFEDNLSVEDIQDILIVADRYYIQCLYDACADYLKTTYLSPKTCANFLAKIAAFQVIPKFFYSCLEVLEKNAEDILKKESLLEITEETLLQILDLENLNIQSELSLINFVVRWVNRLNRIENPLNRKPDDATPKNIRNYLDGKIFSKLRFLSLTEIELDHPILYFITPDEKITLKENLKINDDLNNIPPYFSKERRKRSYDIKGSLNGKVVGLNVYSEPLFYSDEVYIPSMDDFVCLKSFTSLLSSEYWFQALNDVNNMIGYELTPPIAYIKREFIVTGGIYQEDGVAIEEIRHHFNFNENILFLFRNNIRLQKNRKYKLKIEFSVAIIFKCNVFKNDHLFKVNDCMFEYRRGQHVPFSYFIFGQNIE